MSAKVSAFSSSEVESLEREADFANDREVTLNDIWDYAKETACLSWISENRFKRVCLQFPDSYLKHSNAIASRIKEKLKISNKEIKVFILADTSYGSCCVDEIAAAHVGADSLIHFGNACRSKVSRLPVYYCFPEFEFDLKKFNDYLITFAKYHVIKDRVLTIYFDIGYHHIPDKSDFLHMLHTFKAKEVQIVRYCGDENTTLVLQPPDYFSRIVDNPDSSINELDDERLLLFVGSDNQKFFNLSLKLKAAKYFIYDVIAGTGSEKNPLTANFIKRRYYYIEKCKDAVTLGLIVATLTADGYLDVIKRLQTLAKARGIKTQLISVGRINVAKLANFLEIDCFVLIGCPFNNIFESKEFYKPIVSTFEAEMALNPAWHMRYPETYVMDFKELLPQGKSFLEFNANDIKQDDISLLTGRMRNNCMNGNDVAPAKLSALSVQQQALTTQPGRAIAIGSTGLKFEDRTWQGLDAALGQTEPAEIQRGLSGIPTRYSQI